MIEFTEPANQRKELSMTDQETIENLGIRVAALEIRMTELNNLINNIIIAKSPAMVTETVRHKLSKRLTKAQKEERKDKLVADGPYSKADLESMSSPELKMYASALGFNPFGQKKTAIITKLLSIQKTKKTKPTDSK
jgi:hypothetical protein